MNWQRISVIGLTTVLLGGAWWIYCAVIANEELNSKIEWSILQSVEWQHRDSQNKIVEIVELKGYSLVGIPVNDSRRKIWIMLNPQNSPYYKQIPNGSFSLSAEDLKLILASRVVTPTVATCLASHIEYKSEK